MEEKVVEIKEDKEGIIIKINEKYRQYVDSEYIEYISNMVDELIKMFKYYNFEYYIETDVLEMVITAKPKRTDVKDLSVTINYGKDYTWLSIGYWDMEADEPVTVFSFMFWERVPVTINNTKKCNTNYRDSDNVAEIFATIQQLNKITIYIELFHQFVTLTIN